MYILISCMHLDQILNSKINMYEGFVISAYWVHTNPKQQHPHRVTTSRLVFIYVRPLRLSYDINEHIQQKYGQHFAYCMYGVSDITWYFAAGSKSSSDLAVGGDIPWYSFLRKIRRQILSDKVRVCVSFHNPFLLCDKLDISFFQTVIIWRFLNA